MKEAKKVLVLCSVFCVWACNAYAQNHMDQIMMIEGAEEDYFLGGSVSDADDLNNDGYFDVLIGVSHNGPGQVYIVLGDVVMDSQPDIILTGEYLGDCFGSSVSCAGDVNGDSWPDIIIGAVCYDSDRGKVYVYFGGAEFDTIPDVAIVGEGIQYEYFGRVSDAGDVNGDGYDDVIVGAHGSYGLRGKVLLYLGGIEMDSLPDWCVRSEGLGAGLLGTSVSSAGDVNGDGFSDLIVGSLGDAYIFFGSPSIDTIVDVHMHEGGEFFGTSVAGVGDVNGDGYDDVAVGDLYGYEDAAFVYFGGQDMDSIADVVIEGTAFGGAEAVSGAGDVNGDGYFDLLVGKKLSSGWWGGVWLYLGSPLFDNRADLVLEKFGGNFGQSISTAGDVNNDGYDDILVGEPHYYLDSNHGRAYVFAGNGDLTRVTETSNDQSPVAGIWLFQNFPNPFHSGTVIKYSSPCLAEVTLSIYDVTGRLVKKLLYGQRVEGGEHRVTWDGTDDALIKVRNGVYFYKLRVESGEGEVKKTRKMILLRSRVQKRAQPKTVYCALSSESSVPKGTVRLSVLVVKYYSIDSGKKLVQT